MGHYSGSGSIEGRTSRNRRGASGQGSERARWSDTTTSCPTGTSTSGGRETSSPGSTSPEERPEEERLVPPRPLPPSQGQSPVSCARRFARRPSATTPRRDSERDSPSRSSRRPESPSRCPNYRDCRRPQEEEQVPRVLAGQRQAPEGVQEQARPLPTQGWQAKEGRFL